MDVRNLAQVGPQVLADGNLSAIRADHAGSLVVTQAHGRLYEAAYRKQLHIAHAIVTAPVIYTTAAGTGGPILFNPVGNGYNAVILKVSFGISTAAAAAGILGLGAGYQGAAAPGSTTAVDSTSNTFIGGPATSMNLYRVATPANAANIFFPLLSVDTGALTTELTDGGVFELDGAIVVPPGYFVSPSSSATLTTAVTNIGLMWEEVPV